MSVQSIVKHFTAYILCLSISLCVAILCNGRDMRIGLVWEHLGQPYEQESSGCVEAWIAVSWEDYNFIYSDWVTVIKFGVNDRGGNEWYWLFWCRGMGGYNGVDECESYRTWKVLLFGWRKTGVHQRLSRDCEQSGWCWEGSFVSWLVVWVCWEKFSFGGVESYGSRLAVIQEEISCKAV